MQIQQFNSEDKSKYVAVNDASHASIGQDSQGRG